MNTDPLFWISASTSEYISPFLILIQIYVMLHEGFTELVILPDPFSTAASETCRLLSPACNFLSNFCSTAALYLDLN